MSETTEQNETTLQQVPHERVVSRWCPDMCPITMRPFFMWIEHPEKGWVPTYGGPYDSYTIPEPKNLKSGMQWYDIEFTCHHYNHDSGGWVDDEDPGMRITSESKLVELGAWAG